MLPLSQLDIDGDVAQGSTLRRNVAIVCSELEIELGWSDSPRSSAASPHMDDLNLLSEVFCKSLASAHAVTARAHTNACTGPW